MWLFVKWAATFVCGIRRMRKRGPVTVPLHREIAFGTLRRILRDAGLDIHQLISSL
jgi:hypothetical protein